MEQASVVIIGAGLAGLTCAKYLNDYNIPFIILEASEAVGGRVRTDKVDGFLLDRGFQIFLTAYPEAQRLLDYDALDLQAFRSGAIVRQDGKLTTFPNPLKEPTSVVKAMIAPVGSVSDKFKLFQLSQQLEALTDDDILSQPATSTITYLSQYGWSEKIIRNFFQPFLGGVFLEKELLTASNFFRFVFKQFYKGDATLPARGIQAIPEQIAQLLPAGALRLNAQVQRIDGNIISLTNGQQLSAKTIVLATDALSAQQITGQSRPSAFNATTCVYFSAPRSPLDSPMLLINNDPKSLINHICVPSDIAPGYAPAGKALISVNLVGQHALSENQLIDSIKQELGQWFGAEVEKWQWLKTYIIPHALPAYTTAHVPTTDLQISDTLYQCGDYTAYPSSNAAMQTGRQVAEMINKHRSSP
jgi:protoporphyrinogen oxidase